tara:strand:+ start:69 stop:497 length:429 start_codon:yes stop_codon:yes gene_type:complete
MTSLASLKDGLDKLNLTLGALPKSNTTIHSQKQLYNNATLSTAFTFSDTIDLRESSSNRNFRNLSVYGSTTTDSSNVNVRLAISQDDLTYYTLPPNASMVRHQTGSPQYDYHISLANIQVRYVKVYFDAAASAVHCFYIASD